MGEPLPLRAEVDVARYSRPSIGHPQGEARAPDQGPRGIRAARRIIDLAGSIDAPSYFPGDDLLTPLERRVGIPIGNLTSQFFANLYLDDLDHFIKERLGVRPYLRYVDDLVLLDDDKARLWEMKARIEVVLFFRPGNGCGCTRARGCIQRTRDGLDLLGYRVSPGLPVAARRQRPPLRPPAARLRPGLCGRKARLGGLKTAVQSWLGHARHADTEALRRRIFSATIFTRGEGQEATSGCCGAVPGTTNRGTSARRTATGTPPTTATTTSAFVSPSPPARPDGPSPEPARSRTGRAWCAGVHEPASRPRTDGRAE